jgi:hypothetical protein
MHLSRLYDHVFVTCILQMLNEGTVSGPSDIISIFHFSSHIIKQISAALILPASSGKWKPMMARIQHLNVLPKGGEKKSGKVKSREREGQMI